MTESIDPRSDRLYRLLPAIYRMRDAEHGQALQALLRVIAEQVNVVEDDVARLYENWFIETAEPWAVPYIGDLIGYLPVSQQVEEACADPVETAALSRALIPRREVANTIRYRRRKGTLALLELLAGDVAEWPARAVEFFKLLAWTQNLNHQHPLRARTVDVREVERLDLIDGPFDGQAHTVEVRRIASRRRQGRTNIPSVGVFVWRLKPHSVTEAPAYCAENAGPHCYTFSVLGQDAPLFIKPTAETSPTQIAEELNVPAPIRRLAFERHKELFYGAGKSLLIAADGWGGVEGTHIVPAASVIPSDLSKWQYLPPRDHVAVDPLLGRFAFPPGQLPRRGVRVTYHTVFSDDMGAGEYARTLLDPLPRTVDGAVVAPTVYRVGRKEQLHRIGDAIEAWTGDKPWDAVIEVTDSSVYVEPIYVTLPEGRSLQIRAASGARPTLRLLDWQTDLPDAMAVTMGRASQFTLDGFLVTGRAIHVSGPAEANRGDKRGPSCHSDVVIRHCTIVPGWGIDCECEPKRPAEPSLELYDVRARLIVEKSILGAIQIHENEVTSDPIPVSITDSIVDATDTQREAIGAPGGAVAHATLTVRRSTVLGIVETHAVELAQDSIFMGCVNVARRQIGCMRFCYVPPRCRTPKRYRCQPDAVVEEAKAKYKATDPLRAIEVRAAQARVRPQFTASRYGHPAYAQLALTCADEIKRGASDESEMGAFHDLFQPQRETNLATRLDEFTPANMEAGIIFAN